jgi:hypothetical protein
MQGGLVICIVCCLLALASCGSTAPDHPLTAGTGTATDAAATTPTPVSTPAALSIQVQSAQSTLSAYPGGYMTMNIATSPGALCSFIVEYGLGTPSKNVGVVPLTANAQGVASWRWRVDSNAHTGTWPLTIYAVLPNGAKTSTQVNVTVQLAPISVIASQSILSSFPKQPMVLTIATAPSIVCALLLNFGPGTAIKTLQANSNSQGIASWSWNVDAHASVGVHIFTVTAVLDDGERSSLALPVTVQ